MSQFVMCTLCSPCLCYSFTVEISGAFDKLEIPCSILVTLSTSMGHYSPNPWRKQIASTAAEPCAFLPINYTTRACSALHVHPYSYMYILHMELLESIETFPLPLQCNSGAGFRISWGLALACLCLPARHLLICCFSSFIYFSSNHIYGSLHVNPRISGCKYVP